MLQALLVVLLVGTACAGKGYFDNYVVYRVKPNTQGQLDILQKLEDNVDGISVWKEARVLGDNADIMVSPDKQDQFKKDIESLEMSVEVFIADVQETIDLEATTRSAKAEFGWTDYYRLADLNAWLESLVEQYPQVSAIVGGSSYEGREIRGVKLSYKSGNRGIFIEAGIHAREWISPATATFILNELLTSTDPRVRNVAESFDWYIFPSTNPDGYEFTHSHPKNRLWRKTRQPSIANCVGTDPNRNWGYRWGTGGSSPDPCSDIYAGSEAFSAPETRTLSEYLTSISDKIDVYLDFHSYSQLILIPYGTSNPVENLDELKTIANKAAQALKQKYNTKYRVGTINQFMGLASGSSIDWVKGTLGTTISFAFELRDTGNYGFLLPPSQIIPTGEETLDAVVSIAEDTLALQGSKNKTH